MFAYIPARMGSKRIPKKNSKELGGKPVICHVIENLINAGIAQIAVSTDSKEIVDILKSYKEVATLDLRDPALSGDKVGFNDLIQLDLQRFCEHFKSTEVVFTLATAALVKSEYFIRGMKLLADSPTSLVMAVSRYEISPMLTLVKNGDGNLNPLFPNEYLKDTKDLAEGFYDCGSFYIFNQKYFTGKLLDFSSIQGVEIPASLGIDIDRPEDWKKLEDSYAAQR